MRKTSLGFMAELPKPPSDNPAQNAAGMPPATGVFANPVRYEDAVVCNGQRVDLSIRSFGIRGCLLEEDLVRGAVDATRTIFVGLFGRFAKTTELQAFTRLLADAWREPASRILPPLAAFMRAFPNASARVAVQHRAALRSAESPPRGVRSRQPDDLLRDLIRDHMENAFVAACSSYMRSLLETRSRIRERALIERTRVMIERTPSHPFQALFSLLLRRNVNATEARILERLGAIQIHHGSAGSNMVARYLASLHTRNISDIFTAAHMSLDCSRHFGAIADLTDFVAELERVSPTRWNRLITMRAIAGNLPTFGHPEIAAAGRECRIEVDPRPAIYLSSLFEAIDSAEIRISDSARRSIAVTQRMYQIAFVEGIEKPGRPGRLRVAPNTDFGAWIVQECLGVDRVDRTLLSYLFRGFGWMMDVREQLQQPIIRPVIPPDPAIVPPLATDCIISGVVANVHERLCSENAFERRRVSTSEGGKERSRG